MNFSGEFVRYRIDDERTLRDPGVARLVALIAASPIVLAAERTKPARSQRDVPAGFDALDIAILDWIAAEGRRARRRGLRM